MEGFSDRSCPEEVNPDGFKDRTVPHGREPSHAKSLHSGFPVILGHGCLYPGPPPVRVFKLRGQLPGPAFGNPHRLIFIAKIVVLLARVDWARLSKRTTHTMGGVKGRRVTLLFMLHFDRGMSLRTSRDLAPFRKAER